MKAVETGRVRLDYPVRAYVPEFSGAGKEAVTVRDLLLHVSGLPAYIRFFLDYDPEQLGPQTRADILRRIEATDLEAALGERYAYSDLGIILLGEILDRALGETYQSYAMIADAHDWVQGELGILHDHRDALTAHLAHFQLRDPKDVPAFQIDAVGLDNSRRPNQP